MNKKAYLDNIKKYVDFGRLYLCQTLKDLDFIEERYDIETIQDEKEIALKIMEWGKDELDAIDYTDMIWLPNKLFLKPYGLLYDYIMVDECQDLNKAERELILKCNKDEIIKICEVIYRNSDGRRLERKYNKFLKIKEVNNSL